MKTIKTILLAFSSIVLLLLAACKKDQATFTSNGGKPGALTASATLLVLDKTKLADATSAITFSFTAPDYGFSAAVTNTLQIDASNDNWTKATSTTLGVKSLSQGYNTADFNALLLKLNLSAGITSQVKVRVMHTISASVTPLYSNVITLTVTPFNLTSWVYVPGAYEGWSNPGPAEDSLVSVTGNGIYTGIINFTAGNNQFLITPKKTWDHKYGTNDATGSTSSTVAFDGPNNFYAPSAAGQYIVTLNTNTNTITFNAANYYSLIGDATPGVAWTTDTDLKFVNDGNNSWIGSVPFTVGSFKVRQNHDWTYSWGILKPTPDGVTLSNSNDNNIPIAVAGTYKVTFTIPITNVGTTPPTNASYSVK
jgi:hypothetical protein